MSARGFTRVAVHGLAAAAALLATMAAVAGEPVPASAPVRVDVARLAREIEREEDHVTARELAAWIRDRKAGLRVLDVRSAPEYEAQHVPSAERLALHDLATLAPRPGETLVLYSEGGAHAAQAWVLLRAMGHERVYFLRGGLLEWVDDVLNPALGRDTTATGRAADAELAALSRYFGGVPRTGDATDTVVPWGEAPSGRLRSARRRGC